MKISETKAVLFDLQNGLCFYCSAKTAFNQMTFDHIVPKSRGGKKDIYNGVLACKPCNNAKSNQAFIVFIAGRKLRP